MRKNVVIIGACPAGLTAAYELLCQETGVFPVDLEAMDRIGGISSTINYNGNRTDIGGHPFFLKNDTVMEWWTDRMPLQSQPAKDDKVLARTKSWSKTGSATFVVDRVLLSRE